MKIVVWVFLIRKVRRRASGVIHAVGEALQDLCFGQYCNSDNVIDAVISQCALLLGLSSQWKKLLAISGMLCASNLGRSPTQEIVFEQRQRFSYSGVVLIMARKFVVWIETSKFRPHLIRSVAARKRPR